MKFVSTATILSVIIPFKNEFHQLENSIDNFHIFQKENIELIFVDDGSTDQSAVLVENKYPGTTMIKLDGVGTGKAFSKGMEVAKGDFSFLLPVDCLILENSLQKVLEKLHGESADVYVFPKQYGQKNGMRIYALLQNIFLLKFFHLAAWTNGFILKKEFYELLERSSHEVFLVDLILSRSLRFKKWKVFEEKMIVSPRRYQKDGMIKRITINGIIVFLWLIRVGNPKRLHKFYRRGK